MTGLRVFIVLVVLGMVAVSALPLLVVLDLVGGGDGFGLCPDGLGSCQTSYFTGFELAAVLALLVFGLVAILRIAQRAQRRLERNRTRRVSGATQTPRPARRPPG